MAAQIVRPKNAITQTFLAIEFLLYATGLALKKFVESYDSALPSNFMYANLV